MDRFDPQTPNDAPPSASRSWIPDLLRRRAPPSPEQGAASTAVLTLQSAIARMQRGHLRLDVPPSRHGALCVTFALVLASEVGSRHEGFDHAAAHALVESQLLDSHKADARRRLASDARRAFDTIVSAEDDRRLEWREEMKVLAVSGAADPAQADPVTAARALAKLFAIAG